MSDPIEVLIYGLGAIGSFYAFILQRCDRVRLTVIARSNYDAVQQNGILIDSQNHGQHRFRPHKIIRSPAEASNQHFDYVICAHKAIDPDGAVAYLKPVVDDDTTIVIFQNGVGNEDPFRGVFPRSTIISGVVWVGASQPSPGVIHHTVAEDTYLGLFFNDAISVDKKVELQRLETFTSLLRDGGTNFVVSDNIQEQRWEKVVWNVAWNAITTLTMQDTRAWLSSSAGAVSWTRSLMEEVIAVGRACGVPLRDGLVDGFMVRIQELGCVRTSMQADRENGRPMEIEVILGVPVKRGREFGVQTPLLETLYLLLVAVNGRLLCGEKC